MTRDLRVYVINREDEAMESKVSPIPQTGSDPVYMCLTQMSYLSAINIYMEHLINQRGEYLFKNYFWFVRPSDFKVGALDPTNCMSTCDVLTATLQLNLAIV